MISDHKKNLLFCWPRIFLGLMALLFAFFLYFEYLVFLTNAIYKLPLRVVVFFCGQFISVIFAIWAGVLICKSFSCPHCHQSVLFVPLSELYFFLPTLPFSPRVLSLFGLREGEALLLKEANGWLTGKCPICESPIQLQLPKSNNSSEVCGE